MRINRTFIPAEELERLNAITEKIIGCAYKVSNELGCGFLEKISVFIRVHL